MGAIPVPKAIQYRGISGEIGAIEAGDNFPTICLPTSILVK